MWRATHRVHLDRCCAGRFFQVQLLYACTRSTQRSRRVKIIIKRWSAAESFSIFENQVYSHQKNLTFAINFVATPFLGERFFSSATQAKVCNKFCGRKFLFLCYTHAKVCNKFYGNSIFGRKFFFLMLHKQKFAINFVPTPFQVERFFFLMLHKQNFAINFVTTPFQVEILFSI